MSKQAIAMIAALSAGGGAALTAAVYTLRSRPPPAPSPPSAPTAATSYATNLPTPSPPSNLTAHPPSTSTTSDTGPVDPAGVFQYGFPGPVSDVARRSSLVSAYDRRTRNPHWVAEHLTAASVASPAPGVDRRHSAFREDESVPPPFRARLADYRRSGYDRGHQVPAADAKWSQRAVDDTFVLSNICPQVGDGFNRDYWAHLEDFCRRLVRRYPSVRVVTGPLYLPRREPAGDGPDAGKWFLRHEVIGSPPNVAVPTHFYKVIYAADHDDSDNDNNNAPGETKGSVALAAFVLPNERIDNAKPITDFEVPLEVVERASGLEFAANLPVHRRRRLCAETTCSLIIRDFSDKQKTLPKQDKRGPPPS